jgi:N-acetylgalactosamine-6-sulfatase
MRKDKYGFTLVVFFLFSFIGKAQENPPNIVLIVADDLGYGDLECYGATDIKTPHINRLASAGVSFTNFYANAPECTPTRTALLTGRYQQRVGGMECAIGYGNVGRYEEALQLSDQGMLGLPTEFNVLPRILNKKGYNTAMIGKWHLGYGDDFRPAAHGFDYSIGPLGGGVDYFHHTEPEGFIFGSELEGEHDLYRNDKPHHREGYYMTHLITDESVEWLNIQNEKTPFFLYAPYTAPHNPLQGPEDYRPENLKADTWDKGEREDYISLVEELDKGIGQILDKLEEKGFAENTLVIFISDNGPTKEGNTTPFSGNKGHVFEGGIRIPCLIRWPGKIKEGTTSDQMAISMDLTASIASILDSPTDRLLDGMDIIGHVVADEKDVPRTLFWRMKRGNNVKKAVRDHDLKYIYENDNGKVSEHLFNLASDPAERHNQLTKNPQELDRIKMLLSRWEEEVQPERYH